MNLGMGINISSINRIFSQLLDLAWTPVEEDAPNTLYDLDIAFAGAEGVTAPLTYVLLSNSQPTYFTDVSILAEIMTLDYAPGFNGVARLVIRATDGAANYVDGLLKVTILPPEEILSAELGNLTGELGDLIGETI